MEASEFPQLPDGRAPISDKVAAVTIQVIKGGQIPFGQYLPSETALATHWGTTRPTVNRGMQGARTAGLVRLVRGNGWQVMYSEES